MPTSHVLYLGDLRTQCTHLSSGAAMLTDAPTDNNGMGAYFSPTDMLSTSLASCMLTVMGISAQNHKIAFEGVKAVVTKTMASGPRRVDRIQVEITIPDLGHTDHEKSLLKKAALTCPVALSIHPDIVQQVSFSFG